MDDASRKRGFQEPPRLSTHDERSLVGLYRLIRADATALRGRMGRLAPYIYPSLLATALYRLSRLLRVRGHPPAARIVMWLNMLLTGAELEPIAVVDAGFVIAHTQGVLLGQRTTSGQNLFIHSGVVLGSIDDDRAAGFPSLGHNVTIFTKASVVGPVEVGDGAVIGAHALVLHDVPAGMIARGIPATNHPPAAPALALRH